MSCSPPFIEVGSLAEESPRGSSSPEAMIGVYQSKIGSARPARIAQAASTCHWRAADLARRLADFAAYHSPEQRYFSAAASPAMRIAASAARDTRRAIMHHVAS